MREVIYKSALGRWIMLNRKVLPRFVHCCLYIGASVFVLVTCIAVLCLLHPATPDNCIEFQDESKFVHVPVIRTPLEAFRTYTSDPYASLLAFDDKRTESYSLLRVVPQMVSAPNVVLEDTLPVLFAHGHRGAPSQANALATLLHARYHSINAEGKLPDRATIEAREASIFESFGLLSVQNQWSAVTGNTDSHSTFLDPHALSFLNRTDRFSAYTTYSIDFNEESSAFSADVVKAQAYFTADCIATILAHHPKARTVLLVGHSMGGVVTLLSPLMPNYVAHSVDTVFALSTPIQQHPFLVDSQFAAVYDIIKYAWHDGVCPWSDTNAAGTCAATDNVVVVSIHGGASDITIRPDLSFIDKQISPETGFTVSTMALPGAWLTCNHDGIVNCGQVITVLADKIFASQHGVAATPRSKRTRVANWKRLLTPSLADVISSERGAPQSLKIARTSPSQIRTNTQCITISAGNSEELLVASRLPLRLTNSSLSLSSSFPVVDSVLHNHLHGRWDMPDVDAVVPLAASTITGLRWLVCALSSFAKSSSCALDSIYASTKLQTSRMFHRSEDAVHTHDHPARPSELLSRQNTLWLYKLQAPIAAGPVDLCLQAGEQSQQWYSDLLDMNRNALLPQDKLFITSAVPRQLQCPHTSSGVVCHLQSNGSGLWQYAIDFDVSPYVEYQLLLTSVGPPKSSFHPVVYVSSCQGSADSGCESFFLRPSTQKVAAGGAHMLFYTFTVHTVGRQPVLTLLTDPVTSYDMSLKGMGDIALSQWLHHHGMWVVCALVSIAIFTVGLQLKHYVQSKDGDSMPNMSRAVSEHLPALLLFATLVAAAPLLLQALLSLRWSVRDKLLSDRELLFTDCVIAMVMAMGVLSTYALLSDVITGCPYSQAVLCCFCACVRPKESSQRSPSSTPIEQPPPTPRSSMVASQQSVAMRRKTGFSQPDLTQIVVFDDKPVEYAAPPPVTPVLPVLSASQSLLLDPWFGRKRKSSGWDDCELQIDDDDDLLNGDNSNEETDSVKESASVMRSSYLAAMPAMLLVLCVLLPWPTFTAACAVLLARTLWVCVFNRFVVLNRFATKRGRSALTFSSLNLQTSTLGLLCLVFAIRFMTLVHCFEELLSGRLCFTEWWLVYPLTLHACFAVLLPTPIVPARSAAFSTHVTPVKYLFKLVGVSLQCVAGVCFPLCVLSTHLLPYFIMVVSIVMCACYCAMLGLFGRVDVHTANARDRTTSV